MGGEKYYLRIILINLKFCIQSDDYIEIKVDSELNAAVLVSI